MKNKELQDLIEIIRYDIIDLAKWSVYHDDMFNEETASLDDLINKIEEKNKGL